MMCCSVASCKFQEFLNPVEKRSFYSIPRVYKYQGPEARRLSEERRAAWLQALNLTRVTINAYVCSVHFVSGKPADLYNTNDVDWVPTLALTYDTAEKETKTPETVFKQTSFGDHIPSQKMTHKSLPRKQISSRISKPEYQDRLERVLRQTITLLCKNGIRFDEEFRVEALIGITVDKRDVFIVNINEDVAIRDHLMTEIDGRTASKRLAEDDLATQYVAAKKPCPPVPTEYAAKPIVIAPKPSPKPTPSPLPVIVRGPLNAAQLASKPNLENRIIVTPAINLQPRATKTTWIPPDAKVIKKSKSLLSPFVVKSNNNMEVVEVKDEPIDGDFAGEGGNGNDTNINHKGNLKGKPFPVKIFSTKSISDAVFRSKSSGKPRKSTTSPSVKRKFSGQSKAHSNNDDKERRAESIEQSNVEKNADNLDLENLQIVVEKKLGPRPPRPQSPCSRYKDDMRSLLLELEPELGDTPEVLNQRLLKMWDDTEENEKQEYIDKYKEERATWTEYSKKENAIILGKLNPPQRTTQNRDGREIHKEKEQYLDLAYPCYKCGRDFDSKKKMFDHAENDCFEEQRFGLATCPVCRKDFKSVRSMYRHYTYIHKDGSFKCTICSRNFSREETVRGHLHKEHPEELAKSTSASSLYQFSQKNTKIKATKRETRLDPTKPKKKISVKENGRERNLYEASVTEKTKSSNKQVRNESSNDELSLSHETDLSNIQISVDNIEAPKSSPMRLSFLEKSGLGDEKKVYVEIQAVPVKSTDKLEQKEELFGENTGGKEINKPVTFQNGNRQQKSSLADNESEKASKEYDKGDEKNKQVMDDNQNESELKPVNKVSEPLLKDEEKGYGETAKFNDEEKGVKQTNEHDEMHNGENENTNNSEHGETQDDKRKMENIEADPVETGETAKTTLENPVETGELVRNMEKNPVETTPESTSLIPTSSSEMDTSEIIPTVQD